MKEARPGKMQEKRRNWFSRLLEGIRNMPCFTGKDSMPSQGKKGTGEGLLTEEIFTPVRDKPAENPPDPYIVDCVKKVKEVK